MRNLAATVAVSENYVDGTNVRRARRELGMLRATDPRAAALRRALPRPPRAGVRGRPWGPMAGRPLEGASTSTSISTNTAAEWLQDLASSGDTSGDD